MFPLDEAVEVRGRFSTGEVESWRPDECPFLTFGHDERCTWRSRGAGVYDLHLEMTWWDDELWLFAHHPVRVDGVELEGWQPLRDGARVETVSGEVSFVVVVLPRAEAITAVQDLADLDGSERRGRGFYTTASIISSAWPPASRVTAS